MDVFDTNLTSRRLKGEGFPASLRKAEQAASEFKSMQQANQGQPGAWAASSPFPFLAAFDAEDLEEFVAGQEECLAQCREKGDLTEFLGYLRGWSSSAETYDDQVMIAQMYAPDQPDPRQAG